MSYLPSFVSETTIAAPWRLCTLAAAAMLADKQSKGKVKPSLYDMAFKAGTGMYPTNGTTFADANTALAKEGVTPYIKYGAPVVNVINWGEMGLGMVVQGDYNAIDPSLQIQKTDGKNLPHAIYVDHISNGVAYIYDPLDKTGALRQWPVGELQKFGTVFTKGNGINVMLENTGNPNPVPANERPAGSLAAYLVALPPNTLLDTKLINMIMGDVPVDNPNRAQIQAELTSLIGKPINQIGFDRSKFESSSGGMKNILYFPLPIVGQAADAASNGINVVINFIKNPVAYIALIAGGAMIAGGLWFLLKSSGPEQQGGTNTTIERIVPVRYHE